MESTAPDVSFCWPDGAATESGNDVCQFALVFHRQSTTLVELLDTFGSQGAEQGEFLLVLAGLQFEQVETCPQHFAGVSKSSGFDLSFDESVKVLG